MPIYPPRNNPTKKIEILDNKILDFRKCIRQNSSEEKLANKAEKVKVAKLNLIKAKLKLLNDYREEDKTDSKVSLIKKLNLEKIKWESISFAEIKMELCE
jgi:hypothetical protein